ncbi:MAG: hypothetical protein RLO51_11760 [Thalassobaculum sp.]|uniref:hypothetical protein n=1 Tax=Thalassobaculum sp. TaxID=2022740 RepID=UPI0032ED1381
MSDDATIERIRGGKVINDPFPHAVIDGFLHPDLFGAMRRSFPDPGSMQDIRKRRAAIGYSDQRLFQTADDLATVVDDHTGIRPFARLLGLVRSEAFTRALIELFADTVRAQLERQSGDVRLRTPNIDVICDRSGFALPPHTDGNAKLVTALVYLADPGDPAEHGTRLYRPKNPDMRCETGAAGYPFEDFTEVAVAPYRPNTAVLFARSPISFHGVASSGSEIPRRILQIPLVFEFRSKAG